VADSNSIRQFLDLFKSREDSCTFGVPNLAKDKILPDGSIKVGMDYVTTQRAFVARDIGLHLAGRVSIVAIPILQDGTCLWCCIDIDIKDWSVPVQSRVPIYWFRSKSGGLHGFIFFEEPQSAAAVRYWLRDLVLPLIGHPNVEVFPKQDVVTKSGSGVNLPFFGEEFNFNPE
jgi:hypothetical protein